jgi:UDP-glucose 4-epimerase
VILVLGARGFIGSHLVERLEARPFEGRLSDGIALASALRGCDTVIHAAANVDLAASHVAPEIELSTCVAPSIDMLRRAVSAGTKHIVFLSSGGAVYGERQTPATEDSPLDPISSYGLAKLTIERYLLYFARHHGLQTAILRLGNVYGPGQRGSIVPALIDAAERNTDIVLRGDTMRDYVHVNDVVRAVIAAQSANGVFNVGTGTGTKLSTLTRLIEELTGKKIRATTEPRRPYDVQMSVLLIDKAKRVLGWRPEIKLADGVRALIDARRCARPAA